MNNAAGAAEAAAEIQFEQLVGQLSNGNCLVFLVCVSLSNIFSLQQMTTGV